ncbi:hypothetical protein [Gracilibacillus alcaliphilus]|uniref:hypothetical protein n=1 Tax=Gracilibacillus alcaliphilus TaxID=1401441 RepID=UPI00195CE1CD|nr:hypothetical protein [Gracilibacillus alcaliphilus]MBM7678953.1 hypothetical protein [Gracilibacillus alcaliphilus]
MKGVCIDTTNSNVLQEGMTYYVFPHGPYAFYVSKFENVASHTGAFSRDRFEVIEQEETSNESIQMNLFDF